MSLECALFVDHTFLFLIADTENVCRDWGGEMSE